MTAEFHPEAREEFLEAIEFYEERKWGLGTEFKDAVRAAVTAIKNEPSRYQRVLGEVRIFRLKRFPTISTSRSSPPRRVYGFGAWFTIAVSLAIGTRVLNHSLIETT